MPFIWDDNKYQLVDDEDEYDKNRFVISRKLFISLKDDETAVSTVNQVLFNNNIEFTNLCENRNFLILFEID